METCTGPEQLGKTCKFWQRGGGTFGSIKRQVCPAALSHVISAGARSWLTTSSLWLPPILAEHRCPWRVVHDGAVFDPNPVCEAPSLPAILVMRTPTRDAQSPAEQSCPNRVKTLQYNRTGKPCFCFYEQQRHDVQVFDISA